MALYSDFDISFAKNPVSGDIQTVEDTRAAAQSVKNLILTNFFERPFQPPLGSAVYLRLFDQFDSIAEFALAQDIRDVLRLYEPRVTLKFVTVYRQKGPNNEKLDDHTIVLNVGFVVENLPQLVTTQITLLRLR